VYKSVFQLMVATVGFVVPIVVDITIVIVGIVVVRSRVPLPRVTTILVNYGIYISPMAI